MAKLANNNEMELLLTYVHNKTNITRKHYTIQLIKI